MCPLHPVVRQPSQPLHNRRTLVVSTVLRSNPKMGCSDQSAMKAEAAALQALMETDWPLDQNFLIQKKKWLVSSMQRKKRPELWSPLCLTQGVTSGESLQALRASASPSAKQGHNASSFPSGKRNTLLTGELFSKKKKQRKRNKILKRNFVNPRLCPSQK